jgi:hypothetical protein
MFIVPVFYLPVLMYAAWVEALARRRTGTAYNEWSA